MKRSDKDLSLEIISLGCFQVHCHLVTKLDDNNLTGHFLLLHGIQELIYSYY